MRVPPVSFEHLLRLSDDVGLFEHAKLTDPRREHGYCLDDVARGLRVAVRAANAGPAVERLAETYLRFVIDAQTPDGQFRNRRSVEGQWTDEATLEDCWGRALWGLGTVVSNAPKLAERALAAFDAGAHHRPVWSRAMAFAALGAAEVLLRHPDHPGARALLAAAAECVATAGGGSDSDPDSNRAAGAAWGWPEPRLRYANAALPDALIAAGSLLDDPVSLAHGLQMLGWLLAAETNGDHVSVVPATGWAPGEPRPAYDQQPIEVAALADACGRAFEVTGDHRWNEGVVSAVAWFLGENDAGLSMRGVGGGCCDGLERDSTNLNQGAESTLAMMSTFQLAHRLTSESR